MNFTFEEIPESRQETYDPPTYTAVYKAVGEHDDLTVLQYALAATPSTVFRPSGTLYRGDIRKDPDGWAQYLVTVPYKAKSLRTTPVGDYTWNFDTTGATINVKAAKEHIKTYDSGGEVAGDHHKGAINVKSDGEVEGADIVIPALKLHYTFKHPLGVVSEAFARQLSYFTGRVNLNPFRGFAAGELLYIGSVGSDGSDADTSVDYQFVASNNVTNLTIGDISNIVKGGHHYAWVEFKDETVDDKPVRQPHRVHVERMYDAFDFASVFGWS